MKTAGIICEFNPFHYGHKYLIDTVKKNFDAVVCIMSGSFVQRGEAAVFDKWTRTHAALSCGADLVFELPVRYSLSSAQGFSAGSITLLDKTGIIDSVCFGSECADTGTLVRCAELIANEPPEVSEKIKDLMSAGESFPKARSDAYGGLIDANILSQPNNILAIEYIAALKKISSSITPVSIKRHAVEHHSSSANGQFASASMLRGLMSSGGDISEYTPYDFSQSARFDTNKLTDIFKYKLLTCREKIFDGIPDAEPGLAERFMKAVNEPTLCAIIEKVKTKRYTYTRLQRVALSAMLNLTGGYREPEYLRILGMNGTGKNLLAQMRSASSLPIVNKAADFKLPPEDILATNLAALCSDRGCIQNRDFVTSPVIV